MNFDLGRGRYSTANQAKENPGPIHIMLNSTVQCIHFDCYI